MHDICVNDRHVYRIRDTSRNLYFLALCLFLIVSTQYENTAMCRCWHNHCLTLIITIWPCELLKLPTLDVFVLSRKLVFTLRHFNTSLTFLKENHSRTLSLPQVFWDIVILMCFLWRVLLLRKRLNLRYVECVSCDTTFCWVPECF